MTDQNTALDPTTPTADTGLAIDAEVADLLFRTARTANTFTDDPVTPEKIEAIYELVKFGPTALNAQPLRLTLLASPESRARLVPLMSPGNQAKTASAPMVALLSYDIDFHEHLPEVFPVHPGARDGFEGNPERRTRFALMNASLQAGYFIIGIRAAGLAAGPMGGFNHDGVNAEFFPSGTQKALFVVNIGKPGPDAWFGRLPRHPFERAVTIL
jgi:nitroreductase